MLLIFMNFYDSRYDEAKSILSDFRLIEKIFICYVGLKAIDSMTDEGLSFKLRYGVVAIVELLVSADTFYRFTYDLQSLISLSFSFKRDVFPNHVFTSSSS